MARRHRNPEWWKSPIFIGVASFVAGVAVTSLAMRKSANKANKTTYYYWADVVQSSFVGTEYAPKIQNSQTGEVFTLPSKFTEQSALWAAETEIKLRGGTPQAGRPNAIT